MDDVVILTLVVVIAFMFIVQGIVELVAEGRLVRRLMPVEARILNAGTRLITDPTPPPGSTTSSQTDIAGNPIPDSYYAASWEYTVAGKRHEGKLRRGRPIFPDGTAKFGRTTVYYDPLKPSLSRVDMLPANKGKYLIGTGIAIITITLLISFFANMDSFTGPQPAARRF